MGFLMCCLCFFLASCAGGYYAAPEMRARVVTPDGKPVQGAIVAVTWQATTGIHQKSVGQIGIEETITDDYGWFRIKGFERRYTSGSIFYSEPIVRIFKKDFRPLILNNARDNNFRGAASTIQFAYQNEDLVLKPFMGTATEYEEILYSFQYSLDFIYIDRARNVEAFCYWQSIPRLLVEIEHIRLEMQDKGINSRIPSLLNRIESPNDKCGNPKDYFKEYSDENQ
jgi:hypothetical protein